MIDKTSVFDVNWNGAEPGFAERTKILGDIDRIFDDKTDSRIIKTWFEAQGYLVTVNENFALQTKVISINATRKSY